MGKIRTFGECMMAGRSNREHLQLSPGHAGELHVGGLIAIWCVDRTISCDPYQIGRYRRRRLHFMERGAQRLQLRAYSAGSPSCTQRAFIAICTRRGATADEGKSLRSRCGWQASAGDQPRGARRSRASDAGVPEHPCASTYGRTKEYCSVASSFSPARRL
jgi:hypothetical protein